MKILVINGPNLNMLGTREPSVYGGTSLHEIETEVRRRAAAAGAEVDFFQSNHEGELIDRIHQAPSQDVAVIIFNPAGYTHTSVALRDAMLAVDIPFIEVHLSRPSAREDFRKTNYFSDIAAGTISGFGPLAYGLAVEAARGIHGKKD